MSIPVRPPSLSGPRRFDLLGRLLVNMWMQHPNERQIAITLRKVQSVADDEEVGDFEPHIVRLHRLDASRCRTTAGWSRPNSCCATSRGPNSVLTSRP